MPFIGNQPTAVPLTSADITDGIITSAKIADGTIVNADINASAGIVASKLTGISSQPFRNIVINGDMQIAQRNTSVASITTNGYYTLDRYQLQMDSLGTWTMSQSTDVPSGYGFGKSLKLDCTTADASPSAGDYMVLVQKFEGQNLQYLKKGTANAVSLTLSFWIKSTKTGTFIIELLDNDNSRSISKSYTVNASNTWEFKTITFAGDTTGVFDNDNGTSLICYFWLGAGTTYTSGTLATSWGSITTANKAVGQVNIADSTANDFFITGIQLEAGTSATDFEFLPFDVNLDRCQRYFQKSMPYNSYSNSQYGDGFETVLTSGTVTGQSNGLQFMKEFRTTPTLSIYRIVDGTSGSMYRVSTAGTVTATPTYIGTKQVGYFAMGTAVDDMFQFNYRADAEL